MRHGIFFLYLHVRKRRKKDNLLHEEEAVAMPQSRKSWQRACGGFPLLIEHFFGARSPLAEWNI